MILLVVILSHLVAVHTVQDCQYDFYHTPKHSRHVKSRSQVTFTCNSGYRFPDGSESKIAYCVSVMSRYGTYTRQWNQTSFPDCNQERYCRNQFNYLRSVNKIPSYYPRKLIYSKGDTVTFSCSENYKLKSSFPSETKAYCRGSGWSITWPLCTVIRCKKPTSFPGHTEFAKPGAVDLFTDFTVGTKIYFQCKSGLYLWGDHIATCNDNGFWDNIPQCITLEAYKKNCAINDEEVAYKGYLREPYCRSKVIRCEKPLSFPGHIGILKHGDEDETTDYTVGTKISFQCESGLYVWGDNIATCNNKGFWDNIPECITLEAYKKNCANNGEYVVYEGYQESELSCRSKVYKLPPKKQFKTITVVTSIAAGIFGSLLLVVALVAFHRRRLLVRIRRLQESEPACSSEMTSNLDEDIYVQHVLPSYAEAVRNKPNDQPPSFAEATQTAAGSNSSQVDQTQPSVPSTILEATAIDQNNPSPPPYELGATACDVVDGTGAGYENAVFVEDVESLIL